MMDKERTVALADNWLPIGTAPKDGTRLRLRFVPNEVDMPSKAIAAFGLWKKFQLVDGNNKPTFDYCAWQSETDLGNMSYAPTHWQPAKAEDK